ncbi:MAG: thiamine phosphate synthase [Thermodesulfovibrionales bacterium]|nr:thiamine phosphate synthase [Thermodesulfovibrionales bacterium]
MYRRNNKTFPSGLCFITDINSSPLTCLEMTLIALRAGVRWVQYRQKDKSRRQLYEEALGLRRLTADFGAVFIVNDYADIAAAVDADGVHLGQDDLPIAEARKVMGGDRIIGISTHSIKEAVEAESAGADYIGFGPVFPTLTKDAGEPKGVKSLREIKQAVRIPVVAIGGISLKNLPSVISAGADSVAVASAILKGDIEENAGEFLRRIGKFSRKI